MSIIDADPDAGIMLIKHSDNLNLKITIEHGIKEASTEIFLSSYDLDKDVAEKRDPDFVQQELEKNTILCELCIFIFWNIFGCSKFK